MGMYFRDKDGNERLIAGMGRSGELIPSVSKYQSGSVGNPEITNGKSSGFYKSLQVTFDETMPDTDYQVTLTVVGSCWAEVDVAVGTRTTTGFTLLFKYTHGTEEPATLTIAENSFQVEWQAFKLMTDAALLADEAQIEQNKADIAALKTSKQDTLTVSTATATCSIKGNIQLRKYGKVVTLRYYQSDNSTFNFPTERIWTTVGTIPAGYRPVYSLFGEDNGGSRSFLWLVKADGTVWVYYKTAPSWEISVNLTYITT